MIPHMLMLRRCEKEENRFLLRFFFVFVIVITTKLPNAQANDQLDSVHSTASNFQPSLFVVIGVLSLMFSLTFLLLLYAKMCYREPTAIHIDTGNNNLSNRGMFGTHTRFSGLNIEVVESLPFFRFSSLKGAKQGLQCAVCLAEFEDIEILRLLPKCKHGFHIECIDQWLENHSTCPLCRQKVSAEDLTKLLNSSSMRLIIEGKSDENVVGEASSSFELFIEREDDQRSSRFSLGGSFRKILSSKKEEIVPVEVEVCNLHRLNHQIVVSDVVFKNRWSDLSSSDLMFLNSEMLGIMSSDRVCSSKALGSKSDSKSHEGCNNDGEHYSIVNIKEEVERKRMFEHKVGQITRSSSKNDSGFDKSRQISPPRPSSSLVAADHKRAMSEITAFSRFKDLRSTKIKLRQCMKEPDNNDCNEEVKRRRRWFPIARKTVQWFANRENNRSHQQSQDKGQTLLDV